MRQLKQLHSGLGRRLLTALALLLFAAPLLALNTGTSGGVAIPLGHAYSYLEDPHGYLDYAAVTSTPSGFRPLNLGDEPNLGYSSSAFWLRVDLEVPPDVDSPWFLELPFPTLDDIDVYLRAKRSGELVVQYFTGDRHPFAYRPINDANFVFPLPLRPGESYEIFIRVQSEGSLTVGTFLWPDAAYHEHDRIRYIVSSAYLGLLLGLLAYNTLLLFSLRDHSYLLYVLFTASMALAQGSWNGFFFQYLWPESPDWGNVAALVGFNATGMYGALFSRFFLNTRQNAPRIDRFILLFATMFGFLLLTVAMLPYRVHAMLTSATGLAFSFLAVYAGARCLQRGFASARYFLLAWTLLLAGTALLGARNLDLIPTNFFTRNAMLIGSSLEVLLLSFALAERIHAVRGQKEAAEAASHAKDEFLATVSHEIRTPLTVLLGNVSLLLNSTLQPQQTALAQSARRSGEQLLSMLNDLIDLSRIASGQLHLETVPFNVATLVREVVELMETEARDKGLALKMRLGFIYMQVLGDPRRIRQVLLNLVHNAVKFTDRGEIRIEVTVIERVAGCATLRFAVNDTGSGISPSDQERLFRPFSQLQGKQARRGSGLGLAISRRLVEAMQGQIRVFSRPGQGSRFWFDLDLFLAEGETPTEETGNVTLPPLRLLVVDDVEESREVLAAQLAHAGHWVTSANSGPAALDAIERQSFDVVLMDLQMPDMDGYETTRRLRARRPGTALPVFALTADVTSRAQAAALDAGMQGIIAKPLHLVEFNSKLHAFLRQAPVPVIRPAEPTGVLLDRAQLDDRLELLGAEGLGRVTGVFFSVADQRREDLLRAFQMNDRAALAKAAHVLRGSAGAVGLPALLELCGAIEEAAAQEGDGVNALARQLPELMDRSVEALAQWCREHGVTMPPRSAAREESAKDARR